MTSTGSDIDDAINIIEANGGSGEWETGITNGKATPRWLFPRFVGAQNIGTCETHEGEHTRAENDDSNDCVDFTPDMGNMYMSRSGIGYDTDVETVAAWMAAPRNMVGAVNLIGDPGTGKTALAEAAAAYSENTLHTWLCTPDDTRDSLFLRFVGEGKGDCMNQGHPDEAGAQCEGGCRLSPYTLGAIPLAAKHGFWLYLDEWMMLVDGVKPILYSLADGRHMLPGGNVDGSPLIIHPNFRLILSSNPMVRGASMPEPMASRTASTTLTVETGESLLTDLGLDDAVVGAWAALGAANLWRPQIRELRLADYWFSMNPTQAVSAFLPEHAPESQRKQIRNIVAGYLGGHIREDGRLVVA